MRKVYYNLTRKLAVFLPIFLALHVAAGAATAQQQAPLKTSALESHEGLTISALPWTNPALYKEKFHKKSPYAAGIVALQVVFRNDSDDSLKVNLERIRLNVTLSEEDHQALDALTSEQAADVILRPSLKNLGRSRFPIPIGGPKIGRDKKWVEMEQELREAIRGRVLRPGDDGYVEAARIWNGSFDDRRPAVIVTCSGAADVIAAVGFARSNDLAIAVRGGGHSTAGFSTCAAR